MSQSILVADSDAAIPLPRWWIGFAWTAMTVISAVVAPTTWQQITIAVLMIVASLAVQFSTTRQPMPRRAAAVIVATLTGLAAIAVSRDGGSLGYVPVIVVAGRFPYRGGAGKVFLVADTIAFGAVCGIASRSWPAAAAGLAVPLIIQRAEQQREIIRQRDRAQALLAEVQAGRDAETQAAALRERGRIARDLHDVLAHSLAGLSLQLQGIRAIAARAGAGPELTEPIDKAAALARDGLAEAREAVSTLRDPTGLGLDAVPALVERHPGTAQLVTTGDPRPGVTPAAGHAVYRAVQEALTNAARYAPGSPVTVTAGWQPTTLAVAVEDTGPAAGHHPATGQGTGLGLAGMDERVQHAGGSVHAGPRPDGRGWRVEITVPLEESR